MKITPSFSHFYFHGKGQGMSEVRGGRTRRIQNCDSVKSYREKKAEIIVWTVSPLSSEGPQCNPQDSRGTEPPHSISGMAVGWQEKNTMGLEGRRPPSRPCSGICPTAINLCASVSRQATIMCVKLLSRRHHVT